MKRVLYAWELGAGLGHVAAFLPIAEALRARGDEILCATRDTGSAAGLLARQNIPWLQAPFLIERPSGPPLHSYTDILLRYGFADGESLLGHVGSWLSIFDLFRPQLLIADHAPAALLAAKFCGLPTMLFGTGFCCPPAAFPMPAMRPWENTPPAALLHSEALVTSGMQKVATHLGRKAPRQVGELLAVDETAILGFPELDHYPDREHIAPGAGYWGVIGNAGVGDRPRWPDAPGRRLFIYVRPAYAHLGALFEALIELGLPSIVYCPGLAPEPAATLRRAPHICLADGPLDLSIVFAEADAAVTNGSFSSSAGFLQSGKPLLVLPTHLEQYLFGRRVEEHGLGTLIAGDPPPTDLLARLYRVISDPALRRNCEAFAERYRNFDQRRVIANMTQRMDDLVSPRR